MMKKIISQKNSGDRMEERGKDEKNIEVNKKIFDLIASIGEDPNSFDAELIAQIIFSSLRMLRRKARHGSNQVNDAGLQRNEVCL